MSSRCFALTLLAGLVGVSISVAQAKKDTAKFNAKLEGSWDVTSFERAGKKVDLIPDTIAPSINVSNMFGGSFAIPNPTEATAKDKNNKNGLLNFKGTSTGTGPYKFDLEVVQSSDKDLLKKKAKGLAEIKDGELTICIIVDAKDYPAKLESTEKNGAIVVKAKKP